MHTHTGPNRFVPPNENSFFLFFLDVWNVFHVLSCSTSFFYFILTTCYQLKPSYQKPRCGFIFIVNEHVPLTRTSEHALSRLSWFVAIKMSIWFLSAWSPWLIGAQPSSALSLVSWYSSTSHSLYSALVFSFIYFLSWHVLRPFVERMATLHSSPA